MSRISTKLPPWLAGITVALLSVGCTSESNNVFVSLPTLSAPSAIVMFGEGDQLQAQAIDLRAGQGVAQIKWPNDASLPLRLLVYSESLENLGFRVGPLMIDPTARAMPVAEAVYQATTAAPTFVKDDSPQREPPRVIRTHEPCRDFLLSSFPVAGTSGDLRLRRLDADSALAISDLEPRAFIVDGLGYTELENPSQVNAVGAFGWGDGTFRISDLAGRLWSAAVVGNVLQATPIATSTSVSPTRFLAGGSVDNGYELVTLGIDGQPTLIRDGVVTKLPPIEFVRYGGVAWLGPGRAILGTLMEPRLLVVEDGVGRFEALPDISDGVAAIVDLGDRGVYVLVGRGPVFHFDLAGNRTRLEDSPLSLNSNTIAVQGDRLIFAGAAGFLVEYIPGYGFCEPRPLVTEVIRAVIPISSGEILLEVNVSGPDGEAQVFVLTPAPQ